MIDEAVATNAINALKALEPYLIHAKKQKRVAKLIDYLEKEKLRTRRIKSAEARTHLKRAEVFVGVISGESKTPPTQPKHKRSTNVTT